MDFEKKINTPDNQVKTNANHISDSGENIIDDLELGRQQQVDKTEVAQEMKEVRQSITDLTTQNSGEEAVSNFDSQTTEEKKYSNLFDKIKDNKWLKRIALASAIGTAVFNPAKLNAQTEKEALSKNRIELSTADSSANNALEKERAEKLKLFSSLINRMIAYNDLYPSSHLLKEYDPGNGVAYSNENMIVGHLDDKDSKKWNDKKEYDVNFTKGDKDNLANFSFLQTKNEVKIRVGYNSTFDRGLSALRYSYHEQPGFKKMTATEFEGICAGLMVVVEPGYREDMDHHYVWVDDKMNEQKVIDNVLADFNHDDAFPQLEKK